MKCDPCDRNRLAGAGCRQYRPRYTFWPRELVSWALSRGGRALTNGAEFERNAKAVRLLEINLWKGARFNAETRAFKPGVLESFDPPASSTSCLSDGETTTRKIRTVRGGQKPRACGGCRTRSRQLSGAATVYLGRDTRVSG